MVFSKDALGLGSGSISKDALGKEGRRNIKKQILPRIQLRVLMATIAFVVCLGCPNVRRIFNISLGSVS